MRASERASEQVREREREGEIERERKRTSRQHSPPRQNLVLPEFCYCTFCERPDDKKMQKRGWEES